jgi:group I intron endonuclease
VRRGAEQTRPGKDIMNTGVYSIRNVVNGKVYVGSAAKAISSRWKFHRRNLRRGTHFNRHLQAAWNHYGSQAFAFEVIIYCKPDRCIHWEQYYIDKMRAYPDGYNLSPTAGSTLGVRYTAEAKEKLRDLATGRPMPEHVRLKLQQVAKRHKSRIHRARIAAARVGHHHTLESREKVSDARRGQVLSEGHKAAISAGLRKWHATRKERQKTSSASADEVREE